MRQILALLVLASLVSVQAVGEVTNQTSVPAGKTDSLCAIPHHRCDFVTLSLVDSAYEEPRSFTESKSNSGSTAT